MSEYARARGCKTTMVSHLPPLLPPTSMSSAVRNKSAPFLLLIVGSCFLFQEELISSSVSSLKGRRGLRTLLRSERLDLADVQMSEGFEEELPIATISPNTKSTTSTTNNNGRGKYKPTDVLQNKDLFQSALIRSLAIENRQDGFFPQLGFTGPGLFPNASVVEVELMAFQDRARRPWYGTQTVTAMENFSFVISNFPSTISPWTSCPEGILVWFESVDTKVVFSVPAFYLPQQEDQVADTPRENDSDYDEDGGTSQKLIVQTSIVDPGEYRLHIVGFQREGERGNTGDVRPVPGSPWNLRVLPATAPGPAGDTKNDDTRRQEYHATSPATTRIEVPSRTCDLTDLAANEKGRWVECENAGISQEQCLVDGWVYLPNDCQYDIFTTIDGLETSKAIANARQRSSIWIVLVGTSIERGILHAMVDMLSSIGMITDKHGTIDGSISDALFGEVNNDEQGHGSLLKCWGWYDIQIGSIRLSYQDYHNNYIQDEEYRDGALKRWHEILSESPDAVIMGDVNKINHAAIPYNSMIQSVVETQYQGIIIVAPQMERMKTGGIGDSYFCDETFGTEGQATVDSHRSLSGDIRISLDESLQGCHGYCSENTDSLSQNECYEFCSKFRDNVFVADFSTLSWSFTHDAERLMSNSLLSQHYHAYSASESGHPKTMCGSEHSNRQYVLGSVVEMTSQIYLGTILNHLAERSNLATNLYRSKSCNSHPFLLESPNEIDLALRYPFRACFTCPLNTVTPQYTWIPPSSPSQTLTHSKLKNVVEIFQNGIRPNGDTDFCYEGFSTSSTKLKEDISIGLSSTIPFLVKSKPVLPPILAENIASITDPVGLGDTATFIHIPKAGGTSMKHLYSQCYGLVVASGGAQWGWDLDELVVWPYTTPEGKEVRFINIDPNSAQGLERAKRLGLADSGLVDVVFATYFAQAADVFNPQHRARMFTILRHPVDTAISEFYYLQDATWEVNYAPETKDWTVQQYADSRLSNKNFVVRQLVNKPSGLLYEADLELAKEILREKFVIGLMNQMDESVRRFDLYFGFRKTDDTARCVDKILHPDRSSSTDGGTNSHPHPKILEGAPEWEAIARNNYFDIQLYEFALGLFEEQAVLFEDASVHI